MPFGGLLSLAGPALSIGGSLFGMANGTPAQHVQANPYTYQSGANYGAMSGIDNLWQFNTPQTLLPQYQSAAQNIVNNPYASGYTSDAAATGRQGMQSGQALTQSGLSTLPDVQALLALGFDPQNALYSKLQNQNQQQNAAILGQSGVAQTPYGAGVQADANSNFNINWQNQQLQRAIQGAQGAGGLLSNAANTTGTGLSQMAQGAAFPYRAYLGTQNDALGALGSAGKFGLSAAELPQTRINDYLTYLGGAAGQRTTDLNQANSAFGQSQALGQGLGQGLAGLSKGWGNLGNQGWGGSAPNPFNNTGSWY
ncbi:MAG: hypothetical protein KGL35_24855 [Bradyrhizobium sp.]|nr:hypothetical protein [Bradyrhizobium sp.]